MVHEDQAAELADGKGRLRNARQPMFEVGHVPGRAGLRPGRPGAGLIATTTAP